MRSSKAFVLFLALLVTALPAVASSQESEEISTPTSRGDKKEPGIAFVASLIIPGMGQGYNGQWGKAALAFGGVAVGAGLIAAGEDSDNGVGLEAAGTVIGVAVWIWQVIDAPTTASRMNKKNGYTSVSEENPPFAFQPYVDSKHTLGMRMVFSKNF